MKNFLASFVNTNAVAFPNTAAVNSSGGGATDGTEFVKIFVDDIWGFFQDLLNYTDDTPNGNSEVGASQLLESIQKIASYITELTTNTTHTVQEWDKYSVLVLSSGCTIARLVGGTGADETNKVIVQNNNTVTVEIDFGAGVDQEEIIMQPGQWIKFIYDSEASKWIPLSSNIQFTITTAIDYTIGDWLPSGTKILAKPNTASQYGKLTITLPTIADNKYKWYEVEHEATNEGLVWVDGEGAEYVKYNGKQLLGNPIYSKGDGFRYYNNGTDWKMSGKTIFNVGMINRSDYTNVHIGNAVTYDDGSGTSTKSVDWTGMTFSDGTNTATCIYDSGGATKTGVLYFYNITGGTGVFTNDNVLTACNSETIDVNEGTGSSKNIDYNLHYGFGVALYCFDNIFYISTDGTDNNIFGIGFSSDAGNDAGHTHYQINTNSIKQQTMGNGLAYVSDAGGATLLAGDNWYLNTILKFVA